MVKKGSFLQKSAEKPAQSQATEAVKEEEKPVHVGPAEEDPQSEPVADRSNEMNELENIENNFQGISVNADPTPYLDGDANEYRSNPSNDLDCSQEQPNVE